MPACAELRSLSLWLLSPAEVSKGRSTAFLGFYG